MKKQFIALALGLLSLNAYGFKIYALGTSNTNCKGADQAFTNTLGDLFVQDKTNVKVIHGGKDGDVPLFMLQRLEQGLKDIPDIKIVIFEPGPNERNKSRNLEPSEKIWHIFRKLICPPYMYLTYGFKIMKRLKSLQQSMALIIMAIG
jgi:hypothetical protein